MHANVGKNFKHLTLEGFSKSTSQQDNESTRQRVNKTTSQQVNEPCRGEIPIARCEVKRNACVIGVNRLTSHQVET